MIAANVGTWERPCVCFVDAGLEVLGCQDKVCLVVNLPVRGIPGCCPRKFVAVESFGKGELVTFRTLGVSILCHLFLKSSYCPCPVLVCVRAYSAILIALKYKKILLGSLCYDAIKLLIECLSSTSLWSEVDV